MSDSNVEIVERWFQVFHAALDSGEAMLPLMEPFFDPDCSYYPVKKFPDVRPCHGIAEVADFITAYRDVWGQVGLETVEVTAAGDDRVLTHNRLSGEGFGSGVQLAGDFYMSLWLRNGLILREEDHLTEAGARRALGLPADPSGQRRS